MLTRVVNVDAGEDFDILIDRQSLYGNPFQSGRREDNIDKFHDWFYSPEQKNLRKDVLENLRGKRLGCHCHPKPCHGGIFVEFLQLEAMEFCWCRDLLYEQLKNDIAPKLFKIVTPTRSAFDKHREQRNREMRDFFYPKRKK